nr:LuxR family transcriptional regulator [Mycobacterium haemophilum]
MDQRADVPSPLDGSDGRTASLLPGTITLLLVAAQSNTDRLEGMRPEETGTAITELRSAVSEAATAHGGLRTVEQGEGDTVTVAFSRASDAVACALDLQRVPHPPLQLRIGLDTGEITSRGNTNCMPPTMARATRLLDLAHPGQTLLSTTTGDLAIDQLPADTWLIDLGSHQLPDLPRPIGVMQLCHRNFRNEFPALNLLEAVAGQDLPVPLTTFVGRAAQLDEVQELVIGNRLVTLYGAGGVGKTRLALQVAAQITSEFSDGLWYVDLGSISDPDLVPMSIMSAVGLADQPDYATQETLIRFVGDRRMLIVLDTCEHLLDVCGELVLALLGACPALTFLATSREPIRVTGEVTWRVSALSLAEAIELFTDRAGLVLPGFSITDADTQVVRNICRRLDSMPLAIELAAARVATLSLAEITKGLDDRFRLLNSGARTTVPRQQTLRASMDWSHALLTETQRTLFRRLATFPGTFDLTAAEAVAGYGDLKPHQVLDQLTLLVNKSLVVVEGSRGRTRYRLLESVRQYAAERLTESSDATAVHTRHRDHYALLADLLDASGHRDHQELIERAETELDNLNAALAWTHNAGDIAGALQLASSLQPIWFGRGHMHQGVAWFNALLEDENIHHQVVSAGVLARALADKVMLDAVLSSRVTVDDITARAQQALAIARDIGDPVVLARALTACGFSSGYNVGVARPYFDEAIELAQALNDKWTLSQILYWELLGAYISGDPVALRTAAETAQDLAKAIGDRFVARQCLLWFSVAKLWQGDLTEAIAQSRKVTAEAEAAGDVITRIAGLYTQARALAHRDAKRAQAAACMIVQVATEFELSPIYRRIGYAAMNCAALGAGDIALAVPDSELVPPSLSAQQDLVPTQHDLIAQAALARGDVLVARRIADEAVLVSQGWHLMVALTTRARVAIAQAELEQARNDLHTALACGADIQAYFGMPDCIELLAGLIGETSSHEATRLFGAASALRRRTGEVRFKTWNAAYEAAVAALRDAMGDEDFNSAWAEGAALPIKEAIVYAQRGRGKRKRPASGWESLTPAERNVVQLVSEGLSNKDIAKRLFVSVRTVHTHLTHIYTRLGINSRVQLVQEAMRHT